MDFTHWQKRAICNVLEYQSRYCLTSLVCPNETSLAARNALSAALAEAKKLGLPITKIEVKSDHGAVFTAEAFETFITDQGNWHTLSAVGRPQGMGRVERYNRNSKEQRLAGQTFKRLMSCRLNSAAIASFTMRSVHIEPWAV